MTSQTSLMKAYNLLTHSSVLEIIQNHLTNTLHKLTRMHTCTGSMAVLHRIACGVTGVPQVSEDGLLLAHAHHPPRLHHTGTWRLTSALPLFDVFSFDTHVVDGGD